MRRRPFIIMSVVAAIVVLMVLLSSAIWPVINKVETGGTPEYSEIGPAYYSTKPDRVLKEAIAAARELPSMSLENETNKGFDAHMESWLPMMNATVKVRVQPVTEYVTSVNMTSETPLLAGDLGQNARNIRIFINALDQRLGSVRFKPALTKQ